MNFGIGFLVALPFAGEGNLKMLATLEVIRLHAAQHVDMVPMQTVNGSNSSKSIVALGSSTLK